MVTLMLKTQGCPRLTPRAIDSHNSRPISTVEPTYWPSDINKIPDLLDLFKLNNINVNKIKIELCLDLNSDKNTPRN